MHTTKQGATERFRRSEQVDLMPAFLGIPKPQEKPAHPRGQTLCAVTGLPAKYLDPISGLPYANAEAFKKLRNR